MVRKMPPLSPAELGEDPEEHAMEAAVAEEVFGRLVGWICLSFSNSGCLFLRVLPWVIGNPPDWSLDRHDGPGRTGGAGAGAGRCSPSRQRSTLTAAAREFRTSPVQCTGSWSDQSVSLPCHDCLPPPPLPSLDRLSNKLFRIFIVLVLALNVLLVVLESEKEIQGNGGEEAGGCWRLCVSPMRWWSGSCHLSQFACAKSVSPRSRA